MNWLRDPVLSLDVDWQLIYDGRIGRWYLRLWTGEKRRLIWQLAHRGTELEGE